MNTPSHTELKDEISAQIRSLMNSDLEGFDNCQIIQDNITAYLRGVCSRLGYFNYPKVKVTNEGPFIAINFYDKEDNRLETLDDMLEYIGG